MHLQEELSFQRKLSGYSETQTGFKKPWDQSLHFQKEPESLSDSSGLQEYFTDQLSGVKPGTSGPVIVVAEAELPY